MRRTVLIIVGLVLIAGATAAFVYRDSYLPKMTGGEQATTRGLEGAPSTETEGAGLEAFARKRYFSPQLGGWQVFSMVMDVLNFVVGGVGIVLTISGIRMRRASMGQQM